MSRRPYAMPKLMPAQREQERREAERRRIAAAKAAAKANPRAHGPIVPHCAICGCFPAPYGFGVFRDQRPGAVHACVELECRTEAERRAGQQGGSPR